MSAYEFIDAFLAICGGITIVGGAFAVVLKLFKPTFNMHKRVEELEAKAKGYYKSINEIKDAQSILCQGMIALIDSRLTGNNEDNLKKTKDEMIKYLIDAK